MLTYTWLDFQTLGSQPIMSKNLHDHWPSQFLAFFFSSSQPPTMPLEVVEILFFATLHLYNIRTELQKKTNTTR